MDADYLNDPTILACVRILAQIKFSLADCLCSVDIDGKLRITDDLPVGSLNEVDLEGCSPELLPGQ